MSLNLRGIAAAATAVIGVTFVAQFSTLDAQSPQSNNEEPAVAAAEAKGERSAEQGLGDPVEIAKQTFEAQLNKRKGKKTQEQWQAYREEWKEWIAGHGKVDLGDDSYLLAFAYSEAADNANAVKHLCEWFADHEQIKNKAHVRYANALIGIAMATVAKSDDWTNLEMLHQRSRTHFEIVENAYRFPIYHTKAKPEDETAQALKDTLLRNLLFDDLLTESQRLTVLRLQAAPSWPAEYKGEISEEHKLYLNDLQCLDGKRISLSDLKGKPTLVHFWASWNQNIEEELKSIQSISAPFRGKSLNVVGVSMNAKSMNDKGEDTTAAWIKESMKELKMDWPMVYDGKGWFAEAAAENGLLQFPACFLLDSEGEIVAMSTHVEGVGQEFMKLMTK